MKENIYLFKSKVDSIKIRNMTIEMMSESVKCHEESIMEARLEERKIIRDFLENSSVWDSEYIYLRKELLLEKFDELPIKSLTIN